MAALTATGINIPQINTMDEFSKGVNANQAAQINQQNLDVSKQKQYMDGLGNIAAGAAYATDPTTGQVDPTKWNEVVDAVGKSGADVAQFKNHPQMAPMLIKLSLTTQNQIANAQTQQQIDASIQKFGLEVQQFLHPLPVMKSPGDVMVNARTDVPIDGGGANTGFYGNSTEQQALQILANGDPNSYAYAQAYNSLSQPVTTMVTDGDGHQVQVTTPRTLPQGTRPPTYKGAVPAQPEPPGGPRAVAPGGPAANGSGNPFAVTMPQLANVGQTDAQSSLNVAPAADNGGNTGTTLPNGTTITPTGLDVQPTEAMVKSGVLSGTLNRLAPGILKNWSVLADPTQQGLDAIKNGPLGPVFGPFANLLETGDYQTASTNLTGAIQEIVFQLSGANTATMEMINTKTPIIPVFGDKPAQLENKRQNLLSFIQNVADASKNDLYRNRAKEILKEYASADSGKPSTAINGSQPQKPTSSPNASWVDYFKSSLPNGQ